MGKRDGQKDISRLSQSLYTKRRPFYNSATGSNPSPIWERASGADGTGRKAEEGLPEGAEISKRWLNQLRHLFCIPCFHEELYKNKRAITPKERRNKSHSDAMSNDCQRRHKMQDGGIRDRVIDSREKDGSHLLEDATECLSYPSSQSPG